MAKQQVKPFAYEGWNIYESPTGFKAVFDPGNGGKVEYITVRCGRDADRRAVRRDLMFDIDKANDRMASDGWKAWRDLRDAEVEAARKEGRQPLRAPYRDGNSGNLSHLYPTVEGRVKP